MFKAPNKYRVRHGAFATEDHFGPNGHFDIPLKFKTLAFAVCSDGQGWEHVSVHVKDKGKERTPTWGEMCKIKALFWDEDDWVLQFHPAKKDYVNNHPHTLHLWRPVGVEFLTPPAYLVGLTDADND